MGAITNEMVKKSFEIGKQVFLNQISEEEGKDILARAGMNLNTAQFHIRNYGRLRRGEVFKRQLNNYATEYYIEHIFQENGLEALKIALLSLSKHIDYFEETSGSNTVAKREIYSRYLKIFDKKTNRVVYPDEVDKKIKYAEGKTKQVLVNSYERNQIARKKCIEHYGLNCQVCEFNFEDYYGELGKDFIHVHHVVDIASVGDEYSVDPIKDLVPVCPNCHAMLHKKTPAYSIVELRRIIKK